MLSETKRAEIKRFVKETLGCACPDEVFANIEYQNNTTDLDSPYSIKLLIGQRLLIYLLNSPDVIGALELWLPIIVRQGKRERDQKGLNRFRAVIVTDQRDRLEPIAAGLFNKAEDKDDRVHLHVLSDDEIKEMAFII